MSSGVTYSLMLSTNSYQEVECSITLLGSLCSMPTTATVQTTSALIPFPGRCVSQVLNLLGYTHAPCVLSSPWVTAACIFSCCIATLFYSIILFNHPPTDGHLNCFWLGTVMNAAAIHVFTLIFFFYWYKFLYLLGKNIYKLNGYQRAGMPSQCLVHWFLVAVPFISGSPSPILFSEHLVLV